MEPNNYINQVHQAADVDQPLQEYVLPIVQGIHSSIHPLSIEVNNFEIKPSIIQMVQNCVQFNGLSNQDPNMYITSFFELLATFKMSRVSNDAIRLRLSLFSLKDRAKSWLVSLESNSITTWHD